MKSKALFLDRDGVINYKAAEHDYIKSWSEFRFIPHISEAISHARRQDFKIVVVTNQRGVARGLFSESSLTEIHQNINHHLKNHSTQIDAFYYCIHDHDHNCNCRKPKPGLILQAAKDFNLDLAESHLIGDSPSDIQAAQNAGITSAHLSQTNSSILPLIKKLFR